MTTAYLIPCTPDEINSTDLQRTMNEENNTFWFTFRVASEEQAERGCLIFSPEFRRGGLAWGADAQWTDACDAEDVLRRWLEDDLCN